MFKNIFRLPEILIGIWVEKKGSQAFLAEKKTKKNNQN